MNTLNKKLIAGILVSAMAAIAVACGSDTPASEPTATPTPAQPTETPVAPTPTKPPATPTPSQPDVRQQVLDAFARWNSDRPTNYQFMFERICFCPPADPVLVIVNGQQIVSQVDSAEWAAPLTVDEIFDETLKALNSAESLVTHVEFERDLGYPISVSIDQIVGAVDDEVSYRLTEFRILPEEIDLEQMRRDLDQAMFRWFESGPQSYEFVFRWQCFCPPEANSPVRIRVEGGQIVSVADAVSDEPVVAPGGLEYETVTSLFGWISQRLAQEPEFAELEFDAETGYPIKARFNPVLELVDDEEAFFIEELEVVNVHLDLQAELDAARALWDSTAPLDYTYHFNWQCFCLDEFTAQMIVAVERGEVKSVVRVEDGQPVDEQFRDDFVTVDALFDRIQEAIDQGAASIRGEFDSTNGVPSEVFIDYQVIIADEEMGWLAGQVQELK